MSPKCGYCKPHAVIKELDVNRHFSAVYLISIQNYLISMQYNNYKTFKHVSSNIFF